MSLKSKIYYHNYYLNNIEKRLENSRRQRMLYPKECEEYRQKYYKENPEKMKNLREKHRESALIGSYKKTDKRKGLVCDLTVEWMKENITNKPCYYCGELNKIGCDRIDNTKGHTKNNVLPACKICNDMRKNFFSIEEMLKIGAAKKQIDQDRKINKDVQIRLT